MTDYRIPLAGVIGTRLRIPGRPSCTALAENARAGGSLCSNGCGAIRSGTGVAHFAQGRVCRCQCDSVPHKEAALRIADHVSDRASVIGAANTLVFREDGSIHADNTDGFGFMENLKTGAPAWNAARRPGVGTWCRWGGAGSVACSGRCGRSRNPADQQNQKPGRTSERGIWPAHNRGRLGAGRQLSSKTPRLWSTPLRWACRVSRICGCRWMGCSPKPW